MGESNATSWEETVLCWGKPKSNKITAQILRTYIQNFVQNKDSIADFIYWRLYERYIAPCQKIRKLKSVNLGQHQDEELAKPTYNLRIGFSIMANMCLLIEALQTFAENKKNSENNSQEFIEHFFHKYGEKNFGLKEEEVKQLLLKKDSHNFYENIRCGILHQGETTGGWKIINGDKAIDVDKKLINAKRFLDTMDKVLKAYIGKLKSGEESMGKCIKKLNATIDNCK